MNNEGESMEVITEVQAAINAGMQLAAIKQIGDSSIAVLPEGATVVDLEQYLPFPSRRRTSVLLDDLESFLRYVKKFGGDDTQIFASINDSGGKINAILDYHQPNSSSWGDNNVGYTPVYNPEWKAWNHRNTVWMSQSDFAEFLEQNLADVIEPEGAQLLEIARNLQAKKTVAFKSGIRLDNGDEQLLYEETTEAKAGAKGALQVPSEIGLGIQPFQGCDRYKVGALLRYRINEGKLTFKYDLVHPNKIVEAAMKDIVEKIDQETGFKPYLGKA